MRDFAVALIILITKIMAAPPRHSHSLLGACSSISITVSRVHARKRPPGTARAETRRRAQLAQRESAAPDSDRLHAPRPRRPPATSESQRDRDRGLALCPMGWGKAGESLESVGLLFLLGVTCRLLMGVLPHPNIILRSPAPGSPPPLRSSRPPLLTLPLHLQSLPVDRGPHGAAFSV